MLELDLRNRSIGPGRNHYWIDIDGVVLVYCYIRKNACTAFKDLFCNESPYASLRDGSVALKFMNRYHRVKDLKVVEAAKYRICVLRDPVERAVSLFRNKFIAQSGHKDLFESYKQIVGEDPEAATFQDFTEKYLSYPLEKLDPHAYDQASHLMPIRYKGILIEKLHSVMANIIGAKLADRYFSEKKNSTSKLLFDDDCAKVPAAELRSRYLSSHYMPSSKALCNSVSLQRIHSAYSRDYELLAEKLNVLRD